MAIPATSQVTPQRVRPMFTPGGGLRTPSIASLPTAQVQGTPGNAVGAITHLGSGSGSVKLSTTNLFQVSSTTVTVNLSGIPVPYSPSSVLNFMPRAPTIVLPPGVGLGSVSVTPFMRTSISPETAIAASVLGPGITVIAFIVNVTFSWIGNLPPGGSIIVSVGADLVTPA